MSMNDANGEESTDPDWEAIGRDLLDLDLRVRGERVHTELYDLAEQIQNGEEPDPSDLRTAREHLDMALSLVEKHLGPTGGAFVTEFDDDFDNRLCLCTEQAD
jgi:hypothetical protein